MKQITIENTTSYGRFKISTSYRGKTISTTTTNTLAIDRYRDAAHTSPNHRIAGKFYTTPNQAANALYSEIVDRNK